MITHSVNMFRNCSVVHDVSNKYYSTMLYKFVSMRRGKRLNESEKKANSFSNFFKFIIF